jgi:hypothetical protein
MRRGRLSRDEYVRRMRALEQTCPLSACYATYLLLRTMPPSREKADHWECMVSQLRGALDEPASLKRPVSKPGAP